MELKAFKKTVLPLREKILGYAIKHLCNRDDAEDLVQDVFLKLWSIRQKLDECSNLDAFVMEITKNKLIDTTRKQHEEIRKIENIKIISDNRTPAEITEQHDTVEKIEKLINALPPLQQSIIRMKDIEGYETSEIAEIIGTQIEAVRVNLSRARKKIREQLTNIL